VYHGFSSRTVDTLLKEGGARQRVKRLSSSTLRPSSSSERRASPKVGLATTRGGLRFRAFWGRSCPSTRVPGAPRQPARCARARWGGGRRQVPGERPRLCTRDWPSLCRGGPFSLSPCCSSSSRQAGLSHLGRLKLSYCASLVFRPPPPSMSAVCPANETAGLQIRCTGASSGSTHTSKFLAAYQEGRKRGDVDDAGSPASGAESGARGAETRARRGAGGAGGRLQKDALCCRTLEAAAACAAGSGRRSGPLIPMQ